jgi:hypothetical protein
MTTLGGVRLVTSPEVHPQTVAGTLDSSRLRSHAGDMDILSRTESLTLGATSLLEQLS